MSESIDTTTTEKSRKHANFEKYSVFIFGIIFLSIMPVLSTEIPNPSKTQFFAFKLTMALAAGGIGALLPGALNLKLPFIPSGALRAGGAVAIFVLVWTTDPAKSAIEGIAAPPIAEASPIALKFLNFLDAKKYQQAYSMMSKPQRTSISESDFIQLSTNIREPLGTRTKGPAMTNMTPFPEYPGIKGPFVGMSYESRFSNREKVWGEAIVVIAEEGDWKIHSYNIIECNPPACFPLSDF